MARIFFIALVLITSIATAFGQGLCELCESFDQVNCQTINNKMLKSPQLLANATGPIHLFPITDKVDFVETVNTEYEPSLKKMKDAIKTYLSKKPTFERTVHLKDDDSVISLYQRQLKDDQYEYLLVIIESDEVTAVNIVGSLTPAELGRYTYL